MEELGDISEEERAAAVTEILHEFTKYKTVMRAPHFVFYIRSLLEKQFGKDLVEQGGLQVFTTIDPKLQTAAEEIVAEQIKYSKETHGATNGALFSMDANWPATFYGGSADYFDTEAKVWLIMYLP